MNTEYTLNQQKLLSQSRARAQQQRKQKQLKKEFSVTLQLVMDHKIINFDNFNFFSSDSRSLFGDQH